MPKPLRSTQVTAPQDVQFKHFGVLNSGQQSKASLFTSVTLNIVLAIIALIIGAAAKKTIDDRAKENLTFVVPLKEKPPELPKPKIVPPKPLPKPPVIKEIEPPKIVKPEVKIPDPPKPVPVKMEQKPAPVMMPAQPKLVVAAAAPKVVAVKMPAQSASVVNNDAHPSPVRLGTPNSPIVPSDRPPVANAVNLGVRGMNGMPASNTGGGPRASSVNLGNGSPGGSLNGTGRTGVPGVVNGIPHGTGTAPGNATGTQVARVQLPGAPQAAAPSSVAAQRAPVQSGPQVIFKPKPVYTAEATALHLEGTVSVKIHVAANGAVSVVGVTSGLGHGLDESAIRAVQGTRFKPAMDSTGSPTDWDGVVKVTFQMAS